MSVPKKRRTSSSRKRRGSHHALSQTALVSCSECGTRIRPHRVCPECGFYKQQKKVKSLSDRSKKKKVKPS